jgi:hypothetical protein
MEQLHPMDIDKQSTSNNNNNNDIFYEAWIPDELHVMILGYVVAVDNWTYAPASVNKRWRRTFHFSYLQVYPNLMYGSPSCVATAMFLSHVLIHEHVHLTRYINGFRITMQDVLLVDEYGERAPAIVLEEGENVSKFRSDLICNYEDLQIGFTTSLYHREAFVIYVRPWLWTDEITALGYDGFLMLIPILLYESLKTRKYCDPPHHRDYPNNNVIWNSKYTKVMCLGDGGFPSGDIWRDDNVFGFSEDNLPVDFPPGGIGIRDGTTVAAIIATRQAARVILTELLATYIADDTCIERDYRDEDIYRSSLSVNIFENIDDSVVPESTPIVKFIRGIKKTLSVKWEEMRPSTTIRRFVDEFRTLYNSDPAFKNKILLSATPKAPEDDEEIIYAAQQQSMHLPVFIW